MTSEIRTVTHKISVSEVTDVQITESVAADGGFTRAIRIYGEPSSTDGPPVIELLISSDVAANIKITTPEVDF